MRLPPRPRSIFEERPLWQSKRIKRKRSAMKADNSTFGRFKAGATDIVIDDVAAIAKEAGDAIMAIYNGTSEADWKKIADFKADGSLLTKADTTANKIICDALRKKYPRIPIVSEENKIAA